MAAATGGRAKARPAAKPATAGLPKLPPITVARCEAAIILVERMVAENTTLFIRNGQDYRDKHAAGSSRQLTPLEAAKLATIGLDQDERSHEDRAAAFQASEIRAHDEPEPIELLAAAGMATAPAFMKAARRVVALLEMDEEEFRYAFDDDDPRVLDEAITAGMRASAHIEMAEARARASRAIQAFAQAFGEGSGKGVGLLAQLVWQALQNAMSHLSPDGSVSSSLTASAASTGASQDPTSSTS